ncbi:MAG TPA: alpha/beta hydrolase domain-containing protein, partial [Acidimicrobiia bacterium]|nr:alpha/beta hydrolase domain-containing protein [Acidimicrobiia bacterium]
LLLGSTTPLSPERLGELYESEADYSDRYRAAIKGTIEAGFVLEADRAALLEYADPSRLTR